MDYQPKLKSMHKVILTYLDSLYMNEKAKKVFTSELTISFWSGTKLSSCLLTAKVYPTTEGTVGSCKCSGKYCEVCINVNETSTFAITVTEGI